MGTTRITMGRFHIPLINHGNVKITHLKNSRYYYDITVYIYIYTYMCILYIYTLSYIICSHYIPIIYIFGDLPYMIYRMVVLPLVLIIYSTYALRLLICHKVTNLEIREATEFGMMLESFPAIGPWDATPNNLSTF